MTRRDKWKILKLTRSQQLWLEIQIERDCILDLPQPSLVFVFTHGLAIFFANMLRWIRLGLKFYIEYKSRVTSDGKLNYAKISLARKWRVAMTQKLHTREYRVAWRVHADCKITRKRYCRMSPNQYISVWLWDTESVSDHSSFRQIMSATTSSIHARLAGSKPNALYRFILATVSWPTLWIFPNIGLNLLVLFYFKELPGRAFSRGHFRV